MESVSSNIQRKFRDDSIFRFILTFLLASAFLSLIGSANGQTLDDLENLKGTTAKYNGKCDMELYKTYIQPIYSTIQVMEAFSFKSALNDYLATNQGKAELSCYGLVKLSFPGKEDDWDEVFMQCEPCRSVFDRKKTYDCCKCLNAEPYVFEKTHKVTVCQLKESELGDPCDFEMSKQHRETVSDTFHTSLEKAKKRGDYVNAVLDYATASGEPYLNPPTECKEDGKCGCVNRGPYMKYVPAANHPYCVGEKGTLCNVEVTTKNAMFDELAACANDLKCQDAVPGLRCGDFFNKDCVFKSQMEETDEESGATKNVSYPVLLWNLRACGGIWKEKPSLRSGRMSLQPFISMLFYVIVGTTIF